ncbi:OTU domain, ubiquitin aldehyde binding 1, isoform CRA_b [Homo sapiens]|uniref:Isoform 2 of Ubiquitin thioesterase OTUB1 n=1 Tax=Homo sapiens TaxID=9606 RepID=Q96FW1-2
MMKPSWLSRTEFSKRLLCRTLWCQSGWSSRSYTRSMLKMTTSINRRSRTSTKSTRTSARPGLTATVSIGLSDSPTWRHCWMTARSCSGEKGGHWAPRQVGVYLLPGRVGCVSSRVSPSFPGDGLDSGLARRGSAVSALASGLVEEPMLGPPFHPTPRFKAVSAKSKEDLVSQGFTEFTIEDFHNTFMDLIEQVEKQTSVADLLASFNDQSTSDYLVVYLRLLTSGYLQRESKFFEHFIEGGRTVKEFCQQEVEPMCKESDHIHIIALAQALSVSIQVEYMDRGEGGTTNPHIFPEGSEPKVYLLYRPGHYDILYK